MRAGGDLRDAADAWPDRQSSGRHRSVGARIRMGEDEARQAIGERRLADALRAADQPGMVHAAAA